ncbi:MAG: family 1 glycosylhydrolase, partial [Candidatus Sericytochromatia bacterium]
MKHRKSLALAGAVASAAAAGLALWRRKRRQPAAAEPLPEFLTFPEDFVWGAATSSYQVEGGIVNDWSAAGFDAGQAVDHFHRYEEDFDHAHAMGHNAHR